MGFWLTNALATFMGVMNDILRPFIRNSVIVLLDDILIFSKYCKEYLRMLYLVVPFLRLSHSCQCRARSQHPGSARSKVRIISLPCNVRGRPVIKSIPMPWETTQASPFCANWSHSWSARSSWPLPPEYLPASRPRWIHYERQRSSVYRWFLQKRFQYIRIISRRMVSQTEYIERLDKFCAPLSTIDRTIGRNFYLLKCLPKTIWFKVPLARRNSSWMRDFIHYQLLTCFWKICCRQPLVHGWNSRNQPYRLLRIAYCYTGFYPEARTLRQPINTWPSLQGWI